MDFWEYGVLDIYNYNFPGKFDEYFKFIRLNDKILDGDICEIGVYRGKSLLATAMFLKEIGSQKRVVGFDSFSGFPRIDENDQIEKFDELFNQKLISEAHHKAVQLNIKHKAFLSQEDVNVKNVSTSGNFSNTSLDLLKRKIEYLKLDNVLLVEGPFEETMNDQANQKYKFSVALLDCDLYQGYVEALNYVWPKLASGGYIYIDEYYSLKFPGARIACDEFFQDKKERPQMYPRVEREFERWFVQKQ